MTRVRALVALGLALAAAPLPAQNGGAPFTVRETGQSFGTLAEAVHAIAEGRGTVVIAPGRYRDCVVQSYGEVAFVAAQPGTAIFRGGICEGKAAFVLRGRGARIEGLVFENMHVEDKNGAGIRLESGDLTVSETMFRDSENGILAGNDPNATVRIDRSTFSRLGGCVDGHGCSHSLYIGDFGKLIVTRSRFERGTGGHYVKSRTAQVEIVDNSFDDTGGKSTNYMIDLSNGATGTIARNVFVQGRDKENYSAMIMIGAEGLGNSSAGLAVTGNTASIAPGVSRKTSFVADASGDAMRIEGNRLGPGIARYESR